MKRLAKKPLALALGGILLLVVLLAIDVARFAGEFRSFESAFAGSCATIALGGSSEDIQVDRRRGLAYLSVLNRAGVPGNENGTVMLLDLNLTEPAPRAALAYDPPGFRPHGISLLNRDGEPARLFAISHQADGGHVVEIAEQAASGAFFPTQTARDPAFVHPNALAAVGPREFYLVNDSATQGAFAQTLEFALRRGVGTLVYFDGHAAHVVDSGLKFPAGVALSPDGARLYVGEVLGKRLRIYRRVDNRLTLEEVVALGTSPDNLNVDADGVLWIAAHPKLLGFFRHVKDAARRAPTQVLRFDPRQPAPADGEPDTRISQVYADDGTQLSAGTVAAHWRDEFLVGALLEHKVLICKPNP